jgi:DNA-directed RNA polymerase subunit E'/Rpb7
MTQKISLEPSFLDENLKSHLIEKVKKELLGKCDKEYGYITEIYDDIKIINNTISSASYGVFFNIEIQAKVHKPEKGGKYEGRVCMVFSNGIFVEVFGRAKVLIPSDKMGGYKYVKEDSCYKKGKHKISVNDTIQVEIDLIKYEKQNFNCIGSLKN